MIFKMATNNDYANDIALINMNDYMIKNIYKINGFKYYIRTKTENCAPTFLPTLGYIILAYETQNLEQTFDGLRKDANWNPKGFFIIVLKNEHIDKEKVTRLLVKNNAFNVSIITTSFNDNNIYSFGSKMDACNRPTNMELIGRCSDPDHKILIPERSLRSFQNCVFPIVSHNYWPFTYIYKNRRRAGVEMDFLNFVTKYAGVKFDIIRHYVDEDFGYVHINNCTFTGMLNHIETYEAEAAIGGYYLTENRYSALECTYPYFIEDIKVILIKPSISNIWYAVYEQLGYIAITCIILTFLVFCILVVTLSIFYGDRTDVTRDIFIVYGYFFNNIWRVKMRNDTALRIIVLNMLFYVIMINVATQAAVYSVTSHPIRPPIIKDVLTAIDTHQPIIHKYYVGRVELHGKEPRVCNTMLSCLQDVKDCETGLCTILPDTAFNYFVWQVQDESTEFYRTKDALTMGLQAMLFRPGSPVMPMFDKVGRMLWASGISNYILSRIEHKEMVKNISQTARREPKSKKCMGLQRSFIFYFLDT
ncbi:hypothetical protein NE865_06652 [Phthorimaea operculella]|nr:hypothetical protein NE865_06652 [Phthorimaea operculella]